MHKTRNFVSKSSTISQLFLCWIFLSSVWILIGVNCTLDYESMEMAETLRDDIPDQILYHFSNTFVENGKPVYTISSAKAETYSKREQINLYNVTFQEYNNKEEVITEGQAERAILYLDTENAELLGDIYLFSHLHETEIIAPYLYWTKNERRIHAQEDQEVTIFKSDNSYITGKGFSGYTASLTFSFSNSVRGHYENSE